MAFRIHNQDPVPMHCIYQHHPRNKNSQEPVAVAASVITLVEPELPKEPVVEKKVPSFSVQVHSPDTVINHPAESHLPPVIQKHDVVSSLAPVHVDRSGRSPSPAPVAVGEEVVMRIKRRNAPAK
jgi:hypothetical protein